VLDVWAGLAEISLVEEVGNLLCQTSNNATNKTDAAMRSASVRVVLQQQCKKPMISDYLSNSTQRWFQTGSLTLLRHL
jgi:hypothetical protein